MKSILPLSLALLASVASAAEMDGTAPMVCTPTRGHDCVPTETSCKPLKAEAGKDLTMRIDVVGKGIKTPYRTALLPIQSVSNNAQSLVMQGTNLEFAWSATVQRTTGALIITVADRSGAYVIFGQCKLEAAAK